MRPLDFNGWLSENQHLLTPPVSNKQLFTGTSDLIVQVVGGPNQRTDYHVDPYEELFFQLKGNMRVDVMTAAGPDSLPVHEGHMLLLPGGVPHSPQRPEAGSIGLVVERIRSEGTTERFQWYCPSCSALVYETELQVHDIVADLPPVFEAFYADLDARRCEACGTLHPGKG